jgi:hypothetical protein
MTGMPIVGAARDGEASLQRVVLRLVPRDTETPAIAMNDERDMIWVIETTSPRIRRTS